jgi:hypothetical protein
MGKDIREGFGARVAGLALAAVATLVLPAASVAAEPVSFKDHVFMIIQNRCLACHRPGGDGFEKSGLDLRTYDGLMKGTKHGPIVVPGDAFVSNLNVLVEGRAAPEIRMPHNQQPLNAHEIGAFRRWVDEGAHNN